MYRSDEVMISAATTTTTRSKCSFIEKKQLLFMYHSYLEQFVVGSNEGVVTCDGVIGGMVITCFISEWCYMIKN